LGAHRTDPSSPRKFQLFKKLETKAFALSFNGFGVKSALLNVLSAQACLRFSSGACSAI